MQEIALCLSIFLSGTVLGSMVLLYIFVRTTKGHMDNTVRDYNEILKKVSEMNLSAGNKILQLEEKISTLEFWKSTSSVTSSQSSPFKVK